MIKKIGKPIDILKFKRSMLDCKTLCGFINEYKMLGHAISRDRKSRKISQCPVCGSKDKTPVQLIYSITYFKCKKCGLFYTDKQLASCDLEKYYMRNKKYSKSDYSDFRTYKYRTKNTSLPKIEFVTRFIRNNGKHWLDVGSGIGDVVYNLKKKGFFARGLEISEESVKSSKKVFGLNLENKAVSDLLREEGPGSFDVVSYFGVIEHLPRPLEQITCAISLLKPGGLLVLEVPNAESFSVMTDMFFPDSVVRQMVPAFHLFLFSEKSLLFLAKRFNLEPEGMWFIGLDFYNFILHLALRIPGLFESDICKKLLSLNNDFQKVLDKEQMSDEIIFVCRKRIS